MCRKTSFIHVFALILVAISASFTVADEPAAQSYKEMFKANRLEVYKRAVTIRMSPKDPVFKENEVNFLEDALDGKLDDFSYDEAALIVSGVNDPEKMAYYQIQLNEIAKKSEKDVENYKGQVVKGKEEIADCKEVVKVNAIMQSIKQGQMKTGYENNQNYLTKVLDTGNYNCVSSAILFEIMAKRMDIKVATVNIPRHVFCRVDNVDVETTSGKLFFASFRDKRYADYRKPNELKEGAPYAKELSRETSYLGLLALVYFNEGNDISDTRDYGKAAIKHIKAACLDRNNKAIGKQLKLDIHNWFITSMKNHDYKQARSVANMYKKMLRDPSQADYMLKQLQETNQKVAAK